MLTHNLNKVAAACVIFAACTQAVGNDPRRVGAYDFSYATSGDLRATPVQVFDNGRNTYFQFRAGDPIPAIFANRNGATELLVPVHEGPYVKVDNVHGHFTLQLGRSQAQVIHAGGTRSDAPAVREVASSGMNHAWQGGAQRPGTRLVAALSPVAGMLTDDALERNSYATPVRGDRVQWRDSDVRTQDHSIWFLRGRHDLGPAARKTVEDLVKASGAAARYTVFGRDDDTYKEGLEAARAKALATALQRAGVPADRITSRVGIQGSSKDNLWESHVRVEVVLPTQVARPSSATSQETTRQAGNVRANVEELLRSGVINHDQAIAMLRRHGQAVSAASTSAIDADIVPGGFNLSMSDRTIQGTVRRWAQALNYQVVWDAPAELDAPVAGDGVIRAASMKEALEQVVGGLRGKGYALDVTVYSNRVIRFTQAASTTPAPVQQQPAQPSAGPVPATVAPSIPAPRPASQTPGRTTSSNTAGQTGSAGAWSMRVSDGNVQQMLDRWGRDSQWKVIWNADAQVPIAGEANVEKPSFLAAADFVISQAVHAGYQVRAVAYANNTLVVSN